MINKLSIICVQQKHVTMAKNIRDFLKKDYDITIAGHQYCDDCDVIYNKMRDYIQENFIHHIAMIGFCAAGIIIRSVAPLLNDKYHEPPILVIDNTMQYITPLIGGHHGGNTLATYCQNHMAITAVISNQTSSLYSIDNPPGYYHIVDKTPLRTLLWKQAQGQKLTIYGDNNHDFQDLHRCYHHHDADIIINHGKKVALQQLHYIKKNLVLGVGCARMQSCDDAFDLWKYISQKYCIDKHAIAAIATIDIKADEPIIHALADYFNCDIFIYPKEILAQHDDLLKNPSDTVFQEIGIYGVCEAAALQKAGENATLLIEKQKGNNITLALAEITNDYDNNHRLGRIDVVGIGPGDKEYRHHGLTTIIDKADIIIGYDYYCDLIADMIAHKEQKRFNLGEEIDRVRAAINQATEGKNVALVCSGDSGIFAMSTLVYEEIDRRDDRISKGVKLVTHPGISAFQIASHLVGAPFGHDFVIMSLSDLLTPRDDIYHRAKHAAKGNFAIAFYNPQSLKRQDLLPEILEIIRKTHNTITAEQGDNIPIAAIRHAARSEQQITITTLKEFDSRIVDMMTIVLVGNSHTRRFTHQGHQKIYTPRGYYNRFDDNLL